MRRARSRRSRPIRPLVIAVIVLMTAAGCPNGTSDDQTDGESIAGAVVPLMVPRELGLAEHWRIPITEWEEETGATCELREYDSATAFADTTELTTGGALVVCPMSLVPQLHSDSVLAPIPERFFSGWQEVFDSLRKAVGSPGGQPAVFPLSAPPLLCFYRADLLDEAGLAPPTTWADYRQLVATMEEWAPGHTVVEPWGETHRATTFLQRSVGYALHPDNISFTLDVSDGEPLVNQPSFVRVLEEIHSDFAHLDRASLSMDPTECYLQVAGGYAALAIGMLPDREQMASINADSGEGPAVKVGVQPLPGATQSYHTQDQSWSDLGSRDLNSVTVVGPDAWVVCVVGSEDAEFGRSAWSLWNAIDDPENQGNRTGSVFRGGCRPSDFTQRTASRNAGIDAELQRQHISAITLSLENSRVVAELPFPGHDRYRQLMTQRLTEVFEEGREPEAALNDLADDWRQLSEELGESSVLNTYRWCLGLSPLIVD